VLSNLRQRLPGGPPHIRSTRGALPLQLPSEKFKVIGRSAKKLAPPTGSQPLPRWAQGPLSIPYRPDTSVYKLQIKTRSMACIHVLPSVLQLRTSPPVEVGSGTAMCPVAPDLASLLRRAPAPPHVPWPGILPPCRGGLQRCHMSHGPGPHLSVKVGSGAVTCPVASGFSSRPRKVSALPCVTRLWTPPPC
jgi:hypothetical protein